jgi:cytochrome c-type biogenesis protein CcsB
MLDDVMYKSIAVGFAFFTIATVLGALWAAEAWGGYWSWDPKETWALIVWLNYAAWLHMRLMKGLRGTVSAWWALVGLAVTTFAFLGVNMFLSGPAQLRRAVNHGPWWRRKNRSAWCADAADFRPKT